MAQDSHIRLQISCRAPSQSHCGPADAAPNFMRLTRWRMVQNEHQRSSNHKGNTNIHIDEPTIQFKKSRSKPPGLPIPHFWLFYKSNLSYTFDSASQPMHIFQQAAVYFCPIPPIPVECSLNMSELFNMLEATNVCWAAGSYYNNVCRKLRICIWIIVFTGLIALVLLLCPATVQIAASTNCGICGNAS